MAGVIGTSFPAWVISIGLAAGLGGAIPCPEVFGLDVAFPALAMCTGNLLITLLGAMAMAAVLRVL